MMEILERVDRQMNKLSNDCYPLLLANLCMVLVSEKDTNFNFEAIMDRLEVSEEERDIATAFYHHPNTRPAILASCYSRVIRTQFKVYYSV